MTNTTTKKPLKVHPDESGPYIPLPLTLVGQVSDLLDANKIPYEVEEIVISVDGGPEETEIYLDRETDPAVVQRLLDSIP